MYTIKTEIDKLMNKLTHDDCPPELKEIANDYEAKLEEINGASYNDLQNERRA